MRLRPKVSKLRSRGELDLTDVDDAFEKLMGRLSQKLTTEKNDSGQ
jgi:hypothetical protein